MSNARWAEFRAETGSKNPHTKGGAEGGAEWTVEDWSNLGKTPRSSKRLWSAPGVWTGWTWASVSDENRAAYEQGVAQRIELSLLEKASELALIPLGIALAPPLGFTVWAAATIPGSILYAAPIVAPVALAAAGPAAASAVASAATAASITAAAVAPVTGVLAAAAIPVGKAVLAESKDVLGEAARAAVSQTLQGDL